MTMMLFIMIMIEMMIMLMLITVSRWKIRRKKLQCRFVTTFTSIRSVFFDNIFCTVTLKSEEVLKALLATNKNSFKNLKEK